MTDFGPHTNKQGHIVLFLATIFDWKQVKNIFMVQRIKYFYTKMVRICEMPSRLNNLVGF